MHPGVVIIASRDGDLEMTIDATPDGDRSIPGWLWFSSRDGSWDDDAASLDGDRCIPGWLFDESIDAFRDGD